PYPRWPRSPWAHGSFALCSDRTLRWTLLGARLAYDLRLANLTTLRHFSVSSAIIFVNLAGEPGSSVPPRSTSLAFIFGSARKALISVLSTSTIDAGVALGAPIPYHCDAS